MLNNMMNIINNLEERDIYDESNPITEKDINEYGFILMRNSELLGYYGIAISGLMLLNLDNVKGYTPMIVMDGDFYELSDNAKLFIINHELGHYKYHTEKVTNPEYARDINDEFEADEHSASIVGFENAIKALEELKDKLDEISCGLNEEGIKEVDIRIENLMNKGLVLC